MENLPTNPLNTGNGTPATQPPQAPVIPATQAPTVPTPITPGTAPVISPEAATDLAKAEKIAKMKKYSLIGITVAAFLIIAYVAYGFISQPADTIETTQNTTLNNKLSTPSDSTTTDNTSKDKLNDVVNELKEQNKEETSTPPGLTIDLTPPEETTPANNGVKR